MLLLLTSLAFATLEPNSTSPDSQTTEQDATVQEEEVSKEETKEEQESTEEDTTEEPSDSDPEATEDVEEAPAEGEEDTNEEGTEEEEESKPPELTPEERLQNLYQQWKKIDEEAHYKQVQKFLQTGNYASASERLLYLSKFHDGYNTQYFWAFYYELTEDLELSVELFEKLNKAIEIDEDKQDWKEELRIESLFRLGVIYDDLQQYDQAQDIFKIVRKEVKGDPTSKHLLQLLIGTSQIHEGKSWRGVRKIAKSFPKIPAEDGTWIQSRTRNALVFELIRRSEEKKFVGVNKKDRNTMIEKMKLLKDAEAQVVASIQLGEVEYVIKSLLQIIDGYTRLYDEIVAAPAPKELTEEQKQDYKTETKEKAVVLLKAAYNYANKGVVFAQQAQWEGESYDEIQSRQNALKQELE